MAYNESQQPRFAQAVARLHDIKGNPAPQITPEIGHNVELDQVSFSYELEALVGRRNCFAGITAPAGGAGVSSGVILIPGQNTLMVVTGVQVQKATAGFASIQIADPTTGFGGTTAASVAFFRDFRFGIPTTARPFTQAVTRLTGGLATGFVMKRVQLLANVWTQIPITPGLVISQPLASIFNRFGVFNETLNEAMDVMIDFYERSVVQSELVLPQ